jgi:hypothetical protein
VGRARQKGGGGSSEGGYSISLGFIKSGAEAGYASSIVINPAKNLGGKYIGKCWTRNVSIWKS